MQMPRRTRVHGIMHFPWSLPLGPDALGAAAEVRIAHHIVVVTLPVDDGTGSLVAPPVFPPLRPPLDDLFRRDVGFRSHPTLYFVEAARASFLLANPDDAATDPVFGQLGRDFYSWFDIARGWLAAWSGQPIESLTNSTGSALHIPRSDGTMSGTGATLSAVMVGGLAGVSRSQLLGAFARASAGTRLPVEHRLLLDAQHGLYRGDLRRALIDAGTSVEVALATCIAESMANLGAAGEFIDGVIKNANGVVGLAFLYTKLIDALPVSQGRLASELAEPRNRAAHGGVSPEYEVAVAALRHARALVKAVRPLPEE